jgi:hypothetical protein
MALTVTAITPANAPNIASCDITNLAGTDFVATPTVKITKAGQSDINATSVVQSSATKLTCTFPITGAVVGTWTIVVTNPDLSSASLTAGFTIQAVSIEGCDRANKIPKLKRTLNVGIRKPGGSPRPTTGQIYPRGK